MGSQLHTHKQNSATDVKTSREFEPHRLAVETEQDIASQPKQTVVDWQAKLNQAKRFGYNLSQVQVEPNSPIQRQATIIQGKLYLQRSLVDDEQKKDEEVSRVQRKMVQQQAGRVPVPIQHQRKS